VYSYSTCRLIVLILLLIVIDIFITDTTMILVKKLFIRQVRSLLWPLYDIAITNIVLCMAYKRGVGGGGVYCAMVVQ